MSRKITWVIVADAARVRSYAMSGSGGAWAEVEGGTFDNTALHGHSRDVGSDRPGRTVDSAGGRRHAQEARTDPHRQEKRKFAEALADRMEERCGEFDALILIAPPQIMGDLRKALGPQTAKRVVAEIAKDMTKLPLQDLQARLRTLTLKS